MHEAVGPDLLFLIIGFDAWYLQRAATRALPGPVGSQPDITNGELPNG